MPRKPIEQCAINISGESRLWFPVQETDEYYQAFKKFLVDFYHQNDEKTWLGWTKHEKIPITIETLRFDHGGCEQCGTMYEVPKMSGKLKYKGKVYPYFGQIKVWTRYCKCEEMPEQPIVPEFLFDLDFPNGPPSVQFIQLYTELKDMRKVYGGRV